MFTQTSQPLNKPSQQCNLTKLLNIFYYNISYISDLKSKHLALLCTFYTFPYLYGLESYLGPLLHVSVPVFSYVSVPAMLLLALSAHVRAPFCSDIVLTREMNKETWSPSQLNLTFDSIRLRIHGPCLLCATKKANNENNNSMHFSFFSSPSLFFFCFVMYLSCLVSGFPPSLPRDRLSTPAAEKSTSELLEMSSTSWTNGSTKCSE